MSFSLLLAQAAEVVAPVAEDVGFITGWYLTLKKEWAAARSGGRDFANPIEPRKLRWRS